MVLLDDLNQFYSILNIIALIFGITGINLIVIFGFIWRILKSRKQSQMSPPTGGFVSSPTVSSPAPLSAPSSIPLAQSKGVWRSTLEICLAIIALFSCISGGTWLVTGPLATVFGINSSEPAIKEFQLQDGSFPAGITTGPDGNLWFTEFDRNQIGRITPGGTITEFTLPTPDSEPSDITSGPDGNLWFVEENLGVVGRITITGTLTEFSLPSYGSVPSGITTGPDGNLWFTELVAASVSKIGRITPEGSITEYSLPLPRTSASEITTGPDGNLWFTERNGNKIGRITPTGAITEFSLPTPGNGPLGITVGPDHALWFTQSFAGWIGRIATGP